MFILLLLLFFFRTTTINKQMKHFHHVVKLKFDLYRYLKE